jgi:PD-(D/E)XK nuclease superfamily
MTETPLLISRSELEMWARCPRNWLRAYYYGYQLADQRPDGNTNLGIRVHTALEGAYGYGLDPLELLNLLYGQAIKEHPDHKQKLSTDWELARVMVSGYLRWRDDESVDADLKVIYTEAEVTVPLPGSQNVMLRVRLDQVVQQISTGFWFFLDWKTADDFQRHEMIRMDPQMKFYAMVQQLAVGVQPGQLHPNHVPVVNGGIVTTLRRVKRTARAKPPFYERCGPFRYSPAEMQSTLHRTQKLVSEITEATWQMNEAYQTGSMDVLNRVQQSICRPVPILKDCSWSCPLSSGICQMMDDSTGWWDALENGGKFVKADPYAHYQTGGIAGIRHLLPSLSGNMAPDAGEGEG